MATGAQRKCVKALLDVIWQRERGYPSTQHTAIARCDSKRWHNQSDREIIARACWHHLKLQLIDKD